MASGVFMSASYLIRASLLLLLLVATLGASGAERKSKAAAKTATKSDPWAEYRHAVIVAQLKFLSASSASLAEGNDIELCVVSSGTENPDLEVYSRDPSGTSLYVVKRKSLNGDAVQKWVQALQAATKSAKENTLGHHVPAYGVRLAKADSADGSKRILFECTVGKELATFSTRLPDSHGVFALPDGQLQQMLAAELGSE
jgi:hypothetical protein